VYKGQKSGFEALVKKARFCLAPYGWGWGIRISEVGGPAGGWCCAGMLPSGWAETVALKSLRATVCRHGHAAAPRR
jgi:hypothetical protein